MGTLELLLIAVGLSMDAFAVSVCRGLSMQKPTIKNMLTVGLYFGIFQAVMPLLGYFAGYQFANVVEAFDHWIAFGLLLILGINMIIASREPSEISVTQTASLSPSKMLPLALATSIDALAVGVSFAFMRVNILPAITLIGITTFVLSMIGVKTGSVFGIRLKAKSEIAGGIILILIGTKILLEHLMLITV